MSYDSCMAPGVSKPSMILREVCLLACRQPQQLVLVPNLAVAFKEQPLSPADAHLVECSVDIGRSFAQVLSGTLRSKKRRLTPLLAAGAGAGEFSLPCWDDPSMILSRLRKVSLETDLPQPAQIVTACACGNVHD